MKKILISVIITSVMVVLSSCESNPLLKKWNSTFGIPPFEDVLPEHYMPAFTKAMELHNVEIDAIVTNEDAPTFENTILVLDNSGAALDKVSIVFSGASGVASSDTIMAIARELSPIRSRHYNEINLNDALFQKVKVVYDNRADLGLKDDQLRLLKETYKGFERSGANLSDDKKQELKSLNEKISALQLQFGQNLLKETAAYKLVIDKEEDLAGLGEGQIAEAESRAKAAGMDGKWIFGLDNPSVMPFLQYAENAELRKQMLNAYLNRCNNNNNEDSKELIKDLVEYRLEKAKLLGHENMAQYILKERMAKSPEAVYELLDQIWRPALRMSKRELLDMQKVAWKEGNRSILKASDWRYYFEKAKAAKFNLSEDELRPYFEIDNVRDGIFELSNKLYGVTFTPVENVSLPHPEATAFECREADGTHLGILFIDMLARPGEKRGGAWCSRYRGQRYEDGERVAPLVTIVGNFTRPTGGKPALLSADEVETYFHEFGHALHSLFMDVRFSGLTGITRDFVELPSQLMEHWVFEPELLKEYAKHYETGEVIPAELVEKLDKSGKYGQGFATVEFLAASYLDMDYHVLTSIPDNFDITKFESKVLKDRGLISQIPPRYRSTYFGHTMGGGYTAGYYSYIWSGVLDSDAYQAFVESGDIFNKEVATKFRKEILERGSEDEPMTLYVNFRGSKPDIGPLLINRGLN